MLRFTVRFSGGPLAGHCGLLAGGWRVGQHANCHGYLRRRDLDGLGAPPLVRAACRRHLDTLRQLKPTRRRRPSRSPCRRGDAQQHAGQDFKRGNLDRRTNQPGLVWCKRNWKAGGESDTRIRDGGGHNCELALSIGQGLLEVREAYRLGALAGEV